MKFIKNNLLLTLVVALTLLCVIFGVIGYLVSSEAQKDQSDTADFPWSVSPDAGYTLIEETVEYNHFTAKKADGSKTCIDGEGQLIEKCKDGHQFTNGLYEFVEGETSGLKDASGKIIADPDIFYFEDCGEYLITFSNGKDEWKSAALYDGRGKALIKEKSYCHLDNLGNDWFFAECDSNYVYNAKTGEKHSIDDEMMLIHADGKGGFYGEIGPVVEVYPLDEEFQLMKGGIKFNYMADLSEGLRYVQMVLPENPQEEIYGYVNADNKVVINLREEDDETVPKMASPFSEGKAFVQIGANLLCMNSDGEILFRLDVASRDYNIEETAFHEGYAPLSLDDDSFDLFDRKKRYGYVDVSGDFILPAELYAAKPVRGGYAVAAADAERYGILKFD